MRWVSLVTGSLATQTAPYKLIVVHGRSNVRWVEVGRADRTSILAAVREILGGEMLERSSINFIGGVAHPSSR